MKFFNTQNHITVVNVSYTLSLALTLSFLSHPSYGQDGYVGLQYGIVTSEDANMGNGAFSAALNINESIALELQASTTMAEEDLGYNASLSSGTKGLYAAYKSSGRSYFKIKGGVAQIDYTVSAYDVDVSSDQRGFSFGLGAGLLLGQSGAIEVEYVQFPQLESFAGESISASGSYTSVGVVFNL